MYILHKETSKLCFIQEKIFFMITEYLGSKKETNGFDVTMGAYDGIDICELIGIFLLSLTGKK